MYVALIQTCQDKGVDFGSQRKYLDSAFAFQYSSGPRLREGVVYSPSLRSTPNINGPRTVTLACWPAFDWACCRRL